MYPNVLRDLVDQEIQENIDGEAWDAAWSLSAPSGSH
jgi:hypothetical protein